MAIKHTDPRSNRAARAPYNFVPLPEAMVDARPPLDQNTYTGGYTGWIDLTIETCSPTYVRGMLTEEQYSQQGQKKPDALTDEEKKERAPFFSTGDKMIDGRPAPVIPGSSLRGMVRTLVEIIGHGRMRWVGSEPTFTFRAVAQESQDPLKDTYKKIVKNVRAGYLKRDGDDWYISPAPTEKSVGWSSRADSTFVKIREEDISTSALPSYIPIGDSDYCPQTHKVSFEWGPKKLKTWGKGEGKKKRNSITIGLPSAGYKYSGTMVCSGDMHETGGGTPNRYWHYLIFPGNSDKKEDWLKINPQAVRDYRAGLTPFQKEKLSDWGSEEWGCLKHNAPVFYAPPEKTSQEIKYFGHSPNFRIPVLLYDSNRAATPDDFIPSHLKTISCPDMADAIFGWVEEENNHKQHYGPEGQRAGRVFFTDAHFEDAAEGVWYSDEPITPHILAGPKPTTFQHYLAQDKSLGHDPNDRKSLAHYGTNPQKTQIRGYKFYWIKGNNLDLKATDKEREHPTQLTQIMPVKAGVRFGGRVYFERLREEELGLLLWALKLPGPDTNDYRHRLGMGKPLGMGVVQLAANLTLTDRRKRYDNLFSNQAWDEATTTADPQPFLKAIEDFLLQDRGIAPGKTGLAAVERIKDLLTLLTWRDGDGEWLDKTRYMEIEHGEAKVNEYNERPVLPTPEGVLKLDIPQQRHSGKQVPPAITQKQQFETKPKGKLKTGVVKVFGLGAVKNFGFIRPDGGGADFFVHRSELRGIQSLKKGDKVRFRPDQGPKGPVARDVELVN